MLFIKMRKCPCIVAFWEFCFFFKHFLCLCWHAHVFFPPLFHWSCESCWFIFTCHTDLTFWYKPLLVKIYYPFIYRQTPFAKTLWSFPSTLWQVYVDVHCFLVVHLSGFVSVTLAYKMSWEVMPPFSERFRVELVSCLSYVFAREHIHQWTHLGL